MRTSRFAEGRIVGILKPAEAGAAVAALRASTGANGTASVPASRQTTASARASQALPRRVPGRGSFYDRAADRKSIGAWRQDNTAFRAHSSPDGMSPDACSRAPKGENLKEPCPNVPVVHQTEEGQYGVEMSQAIVNAWQTVLTDLPQKITCLLGHVISSITAFLSWRTRKLGRSCFFWTENSCRASVCP